MSKKYDNIPLINKDISINWINKWWIKCGLFDEYLWGALRDRKKFRLGLREYHLWMWGMPKDLNRVSNQI